MIVVNYVDFTNNLKDYWDKLMDEHETVIVTRKDEKNVVIMNLDEYNILVKAVQNAVKEECTIHELIEE